MTALVNATILFFSLFFLGGGGGGEGESILCMSHLASF